MDSAATRPGFARSRRRSEERRQRLTRKVGNPISPNRSQVKPRTNFVLSLILAALMHAWIGHDLLHGHHHEELTDSNYTVIVRSQDSVGHTVVALLPNVEPGSLHLAHPPCIFESIEEQLPPRPLLHHAGPLAPRPPPSQV